MNQNYAVKSEPHSQVLLRPFPELNSEEVQEIISRPPNWMIHWGNSLFFGLLIVLFTGCWLIEYPDIIPASFTLTAKDAPRSVIARSDGKLQRLLIKDGEMVTRGQVLAFGESTGNHEQILQLDRDIKKIHTYVKQGRWDDVNHLQGNSYNHLGEAQNDFQIFAQKLAELKLFLNGGYYLQKRKLLLDDVTDLQDLERNITEQLELQNRDFVLAQDEIEVQEKLNDDKVISTLDYKKEKARFLARAMPLKSLSASLIQNRSAQTAKQKEILELDNSAAEQKNGFLQALQSLQSAIESWKQRYVLSSPVAGRISFAAPWQEQQYMAAGQELLTIEPANSSFHGLVKISQDNLGKVKEGQVVLIKLDGYPFREFGMLEGNLLRLSTTPGRDSIYWGQVSLPNQLNTRYGKNLSYRNGMIGTAEIITADRRLIERLISSFRFGGK